MSLREDSDFGPIPRRAQGSPRNGGGGVALATGGAISSFEHRLRFADRLSGLAAVFAVGFVLGTCFGAFLVIALGPR